MLCRRNIISIAILSFAFFVSSSIFHAQNRTIDSLKILLNTDKEDTNKVIHLNNLCREYKEITNYDLATDINNTAFQLAKKLKFKKGIAQCYNDIANIYDRQGNYDLALKNHFKSLSIRKEIYNLREVATSYSNIGNIYHSQNKHILSLEFHLKSLKIRDSLGIKQDIAASYHNIGALYYNQEYHELALKNYLNSLKIKQEINDKSIGLTYNDIGHIYSDQGKLVLALEFYLKGYEIFKKTNNKLGYINSLLSLGSVYSDLGNNKLALFFYLKGLKISDSINDQDAIAGFLVNIGITYNELNNFSKAIYYCNKAKVLASKINNIEIIKYSYSTLSEIYAKNKNYKKAYQYHILYSQMKDSLLNEENDKNITKLQILYDSEKKDKAITLLQKENEVKKLDLEKKDAEIKYQNTIRNSLIIGSFLIVITGITLVISYQRKIKTNQLLSSQAETLHKQEITNLLKDQNLKTMALKLAGQKDERKRIAMDLHDSLGGTLAGIKLRLINSHIGFENKQELEQLIDSACEEVRTISHDLIPLHLENDTFIRAIQNLTSEFNTPGRLEIHLDFTSEENLNKLSEDIHVEVYRILQELIKNTIKYSQATKLEIDISLYDDELTILFEDNGIGFDTSKKANGIGLKNIASRTIVLNGTFHIDSKVGRGTAIQIFIPIKQLIVT